MSLPMLIGSRISDNICMGRIWVPVRISQPALITDQAQAIAATIMAPRQTALRGQR